MASGPDASNSCIPINHPVIISVPPVPSPVRGERCPFTGDAGRLHSDKSVLVYSTNKLVICRTINTTSTSTATKGAQKQKQPQPQPQQPLLPEISPLPVLVYRGHGAAVTALAVSKSGAYIASGDDKGALRVWAFDHPEHLCKYSTPSILSGPVRDIDWDGESKRLCIVGERAPTDSSGACGKAVQWDTGVTVGQLAPHGKGRAASCSFKTTRPFRIVTAGKDDSKVLLHSGPPFQKVQTENHIPEETAHTKGAVHAVSYNRAGTAVVSVGMDRSICLYDGKTLELKCRLEAVHSATIYDVAFSADDLTVLTASGDGTCKLFAVSESNLKEIAFWRPAQQQAGGVAAFEKVPLGGVQVGCTFVQGKTPVSVGYNGQLSVLNEDGSCTVLTGHSARISGCAVDWTNGIFYTGDTDGVLVQWDLNTCQALQRLEPIAPSGKNNNNNNADLMYVVHTGAISGVAFAQDCVFSVGWDDKLHTTVASVVQSNPASLGAQPSAIAAGTKIACIVTTGGLLVVSNGVPGPMQVIPYEAQAVVVSKDDTTVYVGGKDCKIYVYTVEGSTLTQKHVIEDGHLKPIHCLALSNDGKMLASSDERDVCVWDLFFYVYSPLVKRGKWCFHTQRVTALSWSHDDSILASGGADDSIYLWSVLHKMKRVHYPYAHRGGVVSLHFRKDSLKLLSVGVDAVVNLWDVGADVKAKFG